MKDLVKRLVESYGPAGDEGLVRQQIEEEVRGLADDVRVDALGNLIAHKAGNGKGKKIMLAAHMDEIGIIVTSIDDKGFVRFAPVGGWNPPTLLGKRVTFANGVSGVVHTEHLEDMKDLKVAKLFIDIGARDKASAREKVGIGDMAVFYGPLFDLGDRLVAKAMDDRIGCVVLIEALRQLKSSDHDVYFVFTVQEEVGLRGARTAAYGVDPDIGIACDVTRVGDTPKSHIMEVSLGGGAAIKVKDSSLICHPGLRRYLVEVAKENDIPYQLEVLERGGTDAAAMQLSRAGTIAGVISVPCRYIHSPSEMVDAGDVKACVDLMVRSLQGSFDLE